jgi:hypothetical protein
LLNRRYSEGCGLRCCRIICVYYSLGLGILNSKGIVPLAISCVDGLLLLVLGVYRGREGVRLSRKPTATAVIDLCSVAGGGLDVGDAIEFDKRRAGYEAFYVERGKRDEVVLVVLVDVEDCVTDLLAGSLVTMFYKDFRDHTLTLMVRENDAFWAL